ncbi:MAG: hypothetical protein HY275_16705 [Gemmatimonadetes bacterium]|nr:hypothetical protein [Gemmatimonadota bacterium]
MSDTYDRRFFKRLRLVVLCGALPASMLLAAATPTTSAQGCPGTLSLNPDETVVTIPGLSVPGATVTIPSNGGVVTLYPPLALQLQPEGQPPFNLSAGQGAVVTFAQGGTITFPAGRGSRVVRVTGHGIQVRLVTRASSAR